MERLMRLLAFALVVFSVVLTAQQPPVWVYISQDHLRAGVGVVQSEPYGGAPWAAIPARPLQPSAQVTVKSFRIRAWQETAKSRVVVYAVTEERDSGGKSVEQQTQIATYLLEFGESVDVAATERYGAAHVTLTAEGSPAVSPPARP